jgi:hypothetical protein
MDERSDKESGGKDSHLRDLVIIHLFEPDSNTGGGQDRASKQHRCGQYSFRNMHNCILMISKASRCGLYRGGVRIFSILFRLDDKRPPELLKY